MSSTDTQASTAPLVPRAVQVGKRCFVYCGDDRCDCDAGPLGWHLDATYLGIFSGVVRADRTPLYPPASLGDSSPRRPPGEVHGGTNHHGGTDWTGLVAEVGSVGFDVLGPATSLEHPHVRVLRPMTYLPEEPTRQILYRVRVRRRWFPISSLCVADGAWIRVWAEGKIPTEVYSFEIDEEGLDSDVIYLLKGTSVLPWTPTHWSYLTIPGGG